MHLPAPALICHLYDVRFFIVLVSAAGYSWGHSIHRQLWVHLGGRGGLRSVASSKLRPWPQQVRLQLRQWMWRTHSAFLFVSYVVNVIFNEIWRKGRWSKLNKWLVCGPGPDPMSDIDISIIWPHRFLPVFQYWIFFSLNIKPNIIRLGWKSFLHYLAFNWMPNICRCGLFDIN